MDDDTPVELRWVPLRDARAIFRRVLENHFRSLNGGCVCGFGGRDSWGFREHLSDMLAEAHSSNL